MWTTIKMVIRRWAVGMLSAELAQLTSEIETIKQSMSGHDEALSVLSAHIKPPKVTSIEIMNAVMSTCAKCGLPMDAVNAQFDLAKTGKLGDVILHASRSLGLDHPVRTVEDVVRLFE